MTWHEWVEKEPTVKDWLKNRPYNTQRIFTPALQGFLEWADLSPDEWRNLDRFKARDLAWNYIQPFIKPKPAKAENVLHALKSFYRNLNGERLPFDSGRGGKHYLKTVRKKSGYEHIPDKAEVYKIVDHAATLRHKALLLFLFQSGCRVNVIEHIKYGDVKNELKNDSTMLRITDKLDVKLASMGIPFYITFLNGEASTTLRQYCEQFHADGDPDKFLFLTRTGSPMTQPGILRMFKDCVERAGFDPKTMWIHSLRKAFRKVVRQTDIDDDDKEALMGHRIRGSRESYYDKKDMNLLRVGYMKCNFSRTNVTFDQKVKDQEIEELKATLAAVQARERAVDEKFAEMEKHLGELKKALE